MRLTRLLAKPRVIWTLLLVVSPLYATYLTCGLNEADFKPGADTFLVVDRDEVADLRLVTDRGREIKLFQFTVSDKAEQAEREWEAVYEMLSDRKPGMFGAIIGRAEAQVLRLSVVYALLDSSPEIRSEHQRAALALWEYAEQSARLIFGDATGNPVADTIMRALRDMGEMDRTQINRLFGSHVPAAQIEAALALLQKAGMVSSEKRETGGRQREVWRLTVA